MKNEIEIKRSETDAGKIKINVPGVFKGHLTFENFADTKEVEDKIHHVMFRLLKMIKQ